MKQVQCHEIFWPKLFEKLCSDHAIKSSVAAAAEFAVHVQNSSVHRGEIFELNVHWAEELSRINSFPASPGPGSWGGIVGKT